jgi:hypothetical protein
MKNKPNIQEKMKKEDKVIPVTAMEARRVVRH